MSPVLQSLRKLLERQLADRGVVVWYDPEKAYFEAVDRLDLDGTTVLKYGGSFFKLRHELELHLDWIDAGGHPIPDAETPPRVLIYVPKSRTESQFALVEPESAGTVVESGASVVERNTRLSALVERVFTEIAPEKAGHYARQVEERLLTFTDVEQMAQEAGAASAGAIKLVFGHSAPGEILLRFASDPSVDERLVQKKAVAELSGLIAAETGLANDAQSPEKLRKALVQHLLLGEIALSVPASPWESLPEKPVQMDTIRHLCETWRNRIDLQDAYAEAVESIAEQAEHFLRGASSRILLDLETSAQVDRILILYACELLLTGKLDGVAALSNKRKQGFWPRRDASLLLQWSLLETAADLLHRARATEAAVRKRRWSLDELITAYTEHSDPWMRLDTAARHLEGRYARLHTGEPTEDDVWERLMATCRQAYLGALDAQALAWTTALENAHFQSQQIKPQAGLFERHVTPLLSGSKRTAYLLVDALRYEMAVELLAGMENEFEISLRPCIGQLPGITVVGMAALLPGTEAGLALDAYAGKMQVTLGGQKLANRADRITWLRSKIGDGLLVLKLGDLLRITPKRKKELTDAHFVVVTSQEIDRIGEEGADEEEARLYMDDVLEKLRRVIRNLATVGISDIVITADHGHIFAEGLGSGVAMNTPGGECADLHPRCWVGKGGISADGFFRVSASDLELGGALECAFPRALGTFRVAGGAGAYFHGGASLQEQVLPIAHLSRATTSKSKPARASVHLTLAKPAITNRFFSINSRLTSDEMFSPEPMTIRLEVLAGKNPAGHAAMAAYGFEEGTREVRLEPDKPNAITLMLTDTGSQPITIRAVDTRSDAVVAVMADIPVNLAL